MHPLELNSNNYLSDYLIIFNLIFLFLEISPLCHSLDPELYW